MIALEFCVALGANVFVSSSNKQAIDWAIKAGAKGGVNYRDGDSFLTFIPRRPN
jgi:NADPH:quinone reductase-like Zn-dependent oxidoreductase